MRIITIVSWVVTGLFFVLFLFLWGQAATIRTPYGSPATSFPYMLGVFLFCAVIPTLLWLIVAFTKKKDYTNVSATNNAFVISQHPEIIEREKQISFFSGEMEKLKETYALVKKSFEQKLITEEKFNIEDQRLRSEFDKFLERKKFVQGQIELIQKHSTELNNLINLKKKGIITEVEYESKRDEIIGGRG